MVNEKVDSSTLNRFIIDGLPNLSSLSLKNLCRLSLETWTNKSDKNGLLEIGDWWRDEENYANRRQSGWLRLLQIMSGLLQKFSIQENLFTFFLCLLDWLLMRMMAMGSGLSNFLTIRPPINQSNNIFIPLNTSCGLPNSSLLAISDGQWNLRKSGVLLS